MSNTAEKRTCKLPITGMACAACALQLESVLNDKPGVKARVEFAGERATIEYDTAVATPEVILETIARAGFGVGKKTANLVVEGMACVACAQQIEAILNEMPGVSATVNFAAAKTRIEYVPGLIDTAGLVARVVRAGFGAKPVEEDGDTAEAARAEALQKREVALFLFAALLTLPLLSQMLFMLGGEHAVHHWFGIDSFIGKIYDHHGMLPAWVQFCLATPVQFIAGWRFFKGAWKALRGGFANMDVLVALGTGVAWLYSTVALLLKTAGAAFDLHDHAHFEASATLVTLVLLGKLLEARAKRETGAAIRALIKLQPPTARVERSGVAVEVPVAEISVGEIIHVQAGESVPVDGEIISGHGTVDESMLTGESLPVSKTSGSQVFAATINRDGTFRARATGVGSDTALANIIRLVEDAQGSRAPIQRLADKIAGIFVPSIVGVSVVTFGVTWALKYFEIIGVTTNAFADALINAVSVLVIACPCSLGLATPTAIMVGTGLGARHGILIRNAEVLERSRQINTLVVDKTGTLTTGKPVVTDVFGDGELLALAVALEEGATHPIAEAIRSGAGKNEEDTLNIRSAARREEIAIKGFSTVAGRGVRGEEEATGAPLLLGSPDFLKDEGIAFPDEFSEKISALQGQGKTVVALAKSGALLGLIAVADKLRGTSQSAVAKLRALGIRVVMLTGDNAGAAAVMAAEAGVDDFVANCLPADKAARVTALKNNGTSVVGMVGDGINDAPALAVADISFAIGAGSDIAVETADIVLMRDDLAAVPAAISLSRATLRKIKQNLFWAFIYNLIGIPLAAFGFLSPVVAGTAMAFSSVSVVANSLLLRRWNA